MKTLLSLIFILMSICSTRLYAADTLRLALEDALLIAVKQAPALVAARYDSLAVEGRWRTARAGRFPQVVYSQDAPAWGESIDEQFVYNPETEREEFSRVPSGDLRWQERLALDQNLPWGASLSMSSRLYRRRWYWTYLGEREEFAEYSLVNRAMLDQPLFAGNPVRRDYRNDRMSYDIGLINFEIRRREVIYSVTQAFFGYVSAREALNIARQDLELGRNSEALAERKLQAGLIPEVELLQIKVDVARREGTYRQALRTVDSAKERFVLALGLPVDTQVEAVFELQPEQSVAIIEIDSLGTQLEEKRTRLSLEQLDLRTGAEELQARIRASIQGFYEIDTRRDKLADLKETGDRNVGVTLHFEIPVFGFGSTSGEVQVLRATLNRAKVDLANRKAELAVDLRRAMREVEVSVERMEIAWAAFHLSEKRHKITEDRFENGLVDSRDLLDSQIELTRVKREALNARIDFELANAYLARIAPPGE